MAFNLSSMTSAVVVPPVQLLRWYCRNPASFGCSASISLVSFIAILAQCGSPASHDFFSVSAGVLVIFWCTSGTPIWVNLPVVFFFGQCKFTEGMIHSTKSANDQLVSAVGIHASVACCTLFHWTSISVPSVTVDGMFINLFNNSLPDLSGSWPLQRCHVKTPSCCYSGWWCESRQLFLLYCWQWLSPLMDFHKWPMLLFPSWFFSKIMAMSIGSIEREATTVDLS